jgi:hypothetical protein
MVTQMPLAGSARYLIQIMSGAHVATSEDRLETTLAPMEQGNPKSIQHGRSSRNAQYATSGVLRTASLESRKIR